MRRTVKTVSATRSMRRRISFLALVFLLMAGALTYRLIELQVRSPEGYVAFGESQRVHQIVLPGRRGELLDRNGEQLAISVPQRTVWADPHLVTDPQRSAAELAPILGLDESFVLERLTTESAFVYLSRQVDDETADAVAELNLDGVAFLAEPRRFNTSGSLATSVVGVVGIDHEGLSGIEKQYDDLLSGAPGEIHLETAPDGRTIATAEREEIPAERGADLTLSIDRPLQFEVERMLTDTVSNMGAKGGVVVAMKPATGEILAMSTVVRDVDGNVVPSSENRAVTWAFEPGSITKPLTFAAILEEGVATPDSVRDVPSGYQLYDAYFTDSSPHPVQAWSVTDILVKSSNIGTMLWSMDLGGEAIDDYFRSFGFGVPTSLGSIGESDGIVLPFDKWSGTSIATIPIGQGISVTPIQMLSAFNVIANNGLYVPPQLVVSAADGAGNPVELDSGPTRRVVSEETAKKLQTILGGVVERGTGQEAAVAGYSVAGKTGTAWVPQPNGGYLDSAGYRHYIASFAGFLPAHSPEISILVTIEEPTASIYGGYVAAPLFADISEYAMRRFQIPPAGQVLLTEDLNAEPVDGNDVSPPELIRGQVAVAPKPEDPEGFEGNESETDAGAAASDPDDEAPDDAAAGVDDG